MIKIIKEIFSWITHIGIAIIIVLIINSFIFQPTQVSGSSMVPTLHNMDRVIINKIPHTLGQEYDYNDIVVIDSRVDRERTFKDEIAMNFRNNLITSYFTGNKDDFYWVKRVIGKPGDVLEFKEDHIVRNGEIIEEDFLAEQPDYYATMDIEDRIIEVPEGYVFVMGDNRNYSKDSREIGCVPISNVIGKYWFKIGR